MADHGDAPIRTYSNGQKKKLANCGALVTDAPIRVRDEPFTGGLDPAGNSGLGPRGSSGSPPSAQPDRCLMATQIAEMVEPIAHRIAVL